LAAEEAVEEILEVVLSLTLTLLRVVAMVVVAGILWIGLYPAMEVAVAFICSLLGERFSIDVHHRRTNLPGNPHKLIGGYGGIDDFKGGGVGTCVLLFLSADPVSGEGTGHDGGRQSGKQDKYRSETARTQPFEDRFHGFYNLSG